MLQALAMLLGGATATVPAFHFGVGNGLLPGSMGDPQLYWDEPTQKFHIQPQYSPSAVPAYHPSCKAKSADGWGHATSSDMLGDWEELPIPFGPCAISPSLDMYSSAGTGCTLRINATHVGSLVNGDTSVGWETTNNFAAVVNSSMDPTLTNWTQVSHGIEGNHSVGEKGWIGTPGNHIPAPFGLIGNVVAYHNSSDSTAGIYAIVSTSVGDPRAKTSLPAFMVYRSADFATWEYIGPLYTYKKAMNRAECGDLFPIGTGAAKVTAANVDFGLAASDAWWVLMWSTPDRNGGGTARNAGVVYLIGKMQGGVFVPASEQLQAAEYGNFYASQTVLGPVDGRVIMADLGGGVQSLPRRITLTEADMSLDFQPTSALAKRHTGTAVRASGEKLAAGVVKGLGGAEAFGDAMDLNITVRAKQTRGGSAVVRLRAGNSTTGRCRCTHESAWCCTDGPISLQVNFSNSGSVRPMHTLQITAGRTKITLPVEGRGGSLGTLQATLRVVVDQQIVEVFTGQTPYSFSFMPLSGGKEVEMEAVGGDFEFDLAASAVAAAKIQPGSQ